MSAEIFRPVDIYLAIQKPESLYWQFAISTFQEWRQMLMSGKEIKVEFNEWYNFSDAQYQNLIAYKSTTWA